MSEHSNQSNQSRCSSTTQSVRNQRILSSLSNASTLRQKLEKKKKTSHSHSSKHKQIKPNKKKQPKTASASKKEKSFQLESGDEDDYEQENNAADDEDIDSENDLLEQRISISQLEKLTKHELVLDEDDYDHIKQQFTNLSWTTQYKVPLTSNQNSLNIVEKDQIGFWLSRPHQVATNLTNAKHHHHHHHHHNHHHLYNHNKSHLNSHIASNTFKNFNDWRSHLMYYKQVKGYNHSLPNYLKGNNLNEKVRPANNLPIIEKYSSHNEQYKIIDNPKISYTNLSSFNANYLVSQSGVFQNNQTASSNKLVSQSTTNLNQLSQKIDDNTTSPLNSTLNMNGSKRIKNIDFKIDSSMKRLLESNQPISSQKLMPTTRVNKSIAGPVRLVPKESAKTPQQFQISPHLINKIISSSNSNNNTQNNANITTTPSSTNANEANNYVLNMTSLEEKFVKEFSNKNSSANIQNQVGNTPISEPGKRVIAFYHRVNENDYSAKMQDYANQKQISNQENSTLQSSGFHNHDLVRWSKLTRPTLPANLANIISNSSSKSPTVANSTVNSHISSSLVHKKFNNLSNIQNRLQAQHQQLILHQQLNSGDLNQRDTGFSVDNNNVKNDSSNATTTCTATTTGSTTASGVVSTTNGNSNPSDVIIAATTTNGNSTTRFASFLNQPVKFPIAN